MTPVDMLHLEHGDPNAETGDCFRCCVATILDLPASEVPHFAAKPDPAIHWITRLRDYLAPLGLYYIQVDKIHYCWISRDIRPLVIAGGKSPRGKWGHAVVGELSRDGYRMVHDPHPSRAGLLGEPEDFGLLVKLYEFHRCPVTCQPTVEHHYAYNHSLARCCLCGATSQPLPWHAEHPPTDITTRAINQFRTEFHHAD